ncbi:hypothetical protein Pcinc_037527 [Petrolisthes cinctipes]|uniref:Uncharacterized protein n=1 Tax=Petrolisthes cinctipes TaxID=88211 RepID=A0AAE1BVS5_PETCI|nr:hypothetical protein Pcinc_037527 [Petrolisthes cinctipes]
MDCTDVTRAGGKYCTCYSEQNGGGYSFTFTEYCQDLYTYNFDNAIDSTTVTGLWMFYENVDYNAFVPGRVYWAHGIDFGLNFPIDYVDMSSSLRFAGSPTCLNCDTFTVYDGVDFNGAEYYGVTDSYDLGALDAKVSSIVITGYTAWTFYEGLSFTGFSVCLYPDTFHTEGPGGLTLDLGMYPDVTQVQLYDNAVRSVRQGCFSEKVVKASSIKAEFRSEKGAWGYLN